MDWKELAGAMPLKQIEQALDDDGDGIADADAWVLVQSDAEDRIQSCFGGPVPAQHVTATKLPRRLFLLESLFNRRGITEGNPYTKRAAEAETRLRGLASGEETTSGDSGAVFVGQPAKISGTPGMMA